MRILSLVGVLLLLTSLYLAASVPVFGDTSGTVTATVNVQDVPCITIGTPTINYGTLSFGGNSGRMIQDIDNCSTITQELFAQGADTTSGPSWQLVDTGSCPTLPINQFRHQIDRIDAGFVSLSPTVAKSLGTMTPTTDNVILDTIFFMPCTGSIGAGQAAGTSISLTAVVPTP